MTDKEKIIKGIAAHIDPHIPCESCPYWCNWESGCFSMLLRDIVKMVADQPKWIPVKEKLPERNDKYLVISDSPICRRILIASFAKNLEKVDKYAFPLRGKKRPGWYDYSCDWGYFEYDNVTHWMPIPEMPEGVNDNA